MKKKKVEDAEIVEKKEEAKVEEKPVDPKVSVEMTPEQKDEFVAFMAAKKKEEAPKEFLRMELAYRHYINGKKYGPGMAEFPAELHGLLQKQEERQLYREITLNQSKTNFYKVVARGNAVKVGSMPR